MSTLELELQRIGALEGIMRIARRAGQSVEEALQEFATRGYQEDKQEGMGEKRARDFAEFKRLEDRMLDNPTDEEVEALRQLLVALTPQFDGVKASEYIFLAGGPERDDFD